MNDEAPLLRCYSMSTTGTRKRSFKQVVRERDGKCVISGRRPFANDWTGLQAAHIFPLAYREYWISHNYGRWVTVPSTDKINSVQNGLLLRADIHHLFDSYYISINPDVLIPNVKVSYTVMADYFRIITKWSASEVMWMISAVSF